MTTTVQDPDRGDRAHDAAPQTVARPVGPQAPHGPFTPAPRQARGIRPAWNFVEHVPGAFARWTAECIRFGGRRRRREAAQAAYDARWAGHGVGACGAEAWLGPDVAIEIGSSLQQARRVRATSGGPGAR